MKRRPVFARFYEWLSRGEDVMIRRFRAEAAGGAEGLILEVGAGNGLNFAHYPKEATVIAVEPQPAMLARARRRASGRGVHLVRAAAEALPFRDGAFDTAVVSLVMCSVADQARAVGEVARTLRPGGTVRLFEHVRSSDPRTARWQDRLNRPYGWFAGGCNLNRDTVGTLRAAGFGVRFRRVYGPALAPHLLGTARRP
ncbi:MAG TPA: class I SAM-dependent methyltransferase [Actinomycetota bacterium]|jgi:ubiquinone/menaquinone biosynthesis C-methylase UbiE